MTRTSWKAQTKIRRKEIAIRNTTCSDGVQMPEMAGLGMATERDDPGYAGRAAVITCDDGPYSVLGEAKNVCQPGWERACRLARRPSRGGCPLLEKWAEEPGYTTMNQ